MFLIMKIINEISSTNLRDGGTREDLEEDGETKKQLDL
jgi:hypothetical protein